MGAIIEIAHGWLKKSERAFAVGREALCRKWKVCVLREVEEEEVGLCEPQTHRYCVSVTTASTPLRAVSQHNARKVLGSAAAMVAAKMRGRSPCACYVKTESFPSY